MNKRKIDEDVFLKAVGNVLARGDFFLIPKSISFDYGTDALYDDPVLWHFKIGFEFVCKDEEEKSRLGKQIEAEYDRLMKETK